MISENVTTEMRCRFEALPGDGPRDGEYEFIDPCDAHRDLASTGVFHRMELWKHRTLPRFIEVGKCVNESIRDIPPDTPEFERRFEFESPNKITERMYGFEL